MEKDNNKETMQCTLHSVSERLSYNDLFEIYKKKYNNKPKHDYSHFITTMAKIDHHSTLIRPQIQWWENVR